MLKTNSLKKLTDNEQNVTIISTKELPVFVNQGALRPPEIVSIKTVSFIIFELNFIRKNIKILQKKR